MTPYFKIYWEHINKKESVFHYDIITDNKEYKFELHKTRKEEIK